QDTAFGYIEHPDQPFWSPVELCTTPQTGCDKPLHHQVAEALPLRRLYERAARLGPAQPETAITSLAIQIPFDLHTARRYGKRTMLRRIGGELVQGHADVLCCFGVEQHRRTRGCHPRFARINEGLELGRDDVRQRNTLPVSVNEQVV